MITWLTPGDQDHLDQRSSALIYDLIRIQVIRIQVTIRRLARGWDVRQLDQQLTMPRSQNNI